MHSRGLDERSSLPTPPTPLIGRRRELRALRREILSERTRLLTLTGSGGCGKTRLAIALASLVERSFAHGASFVDLSAIADPGHVASALAHALDVPESTTGSLFDRLLEHLRDRDLLLLLDNFEHLLVASSLLSELLAACQRVRMLVTSRERLHLRWEREWPVPTLELPQLEQAQDPLLLSAVPAVALFAERARAVDPSFAITSRNALAVAELCVRLDGLPLAIELAAAQAKALTPHEMLSRLGDRLDLLATADHDVPPRHRTLRAAMDRSYELLDDDERAAFRRLAAFSGGFTIEAAEAIAASSRDALQLVSGLLDKNLVRREPPSDDGTVRYGMLATIRDYAWARLVESGEAEWTRARHAAYFVGIAERLDPELRGPLQQASFAQLERERDNFRAALRWSLETDEVGSGLRLGAALGRFWSVRGYLAEGLRWLTALLALPSSPRRTLARARALVQAAALAQPFGRSEARPLAEEALAIARDLGDDRVAADALQELAYRLLALGAQDEAEAKIADCLQIRRRLGDPQLLARTLNFAGDIARYGGDDAHAQACYAECVELARGSNELTFGVGLFNLAHVALRRGDHQRAQSLFRESLLIGRRLRDVGLVAQCVAGFAGAAAVAKDVQRMGRLLGAAQALLETNGWLMASPSADRVAYDRAVALVRETLGEAMFARTVGEGRAMSREQAIAYALREATASADHGPIQGPDRLRGPSAPLTRREAEVAVLVARGLTNLEIAQTLVIGERTVETHVERILRKLDLGSRTELAIWALEHSLGPPRSGSGRSDVRTATDDRRASAD